MKKKWSLLILLVLLSFFYAMYHTKIGLSSDSTATLPMSMDFVKGNVLLKGWIQGTNSFLFTEIFIYAIGLFFGFSSFALINGVPGIFYSLLLVGMILLLDFDETYQEMNKAQKYFLIIMLIIILGLVPYSATYTLLNANSHNNLYTFLVIYLLFLFQYLKGKNSCIIWSVVLAIAMSISEGVTSMVLFAPIGCFCILFFVKTQNRAYCKIFGSLCISYVTAKIFIWLLERAGGVITRGFPVRLVQPKEIIPRVMLWWKESKVLMGIPGDLNSVDNPIEFCTYFVLIMLMLWIIISLLYYTINIFRCSKVESVLYFITTINMVACVLTNVVIFHRYIVPGWFFGIVLALLLLVKLVNKLQWRKIKIGLGASIVVFCAMIGGVRLSEIQSAYTVGEEQRELISTIAEKGYGEGYGSFWCASLNSYYSNYFVPIYPVEIRTEKYIAAYPELIYRDWYEEKNKHFIVMQKGQDDFIDKNQMIQMLGSPQDSFNTGKYEVFYWEKDISTYVVHGHLGKK